MGSFLSSVTEILIASSSNDSGDLLDVGEVESFLSLAVKSSSSPILARRLLAASNFLFRYSV